MPAQSPTNGSTTGGSSNATPPSSASSNPQPTSQGPPRFNKIPILTSKSRSFFLFLAAGAVIIGLIVVFFLVGKKYIEVSYPDRGLGPDIAASVNGEEISREEYESVLSAHIDYFMEVFPTDTGEQVSEEYLESLKKSTLDNLTLDILLSSYLESKGVQIDDDQVRERIADTIVNESFGGDWSAYETSLVKNKSNLNIVMKKFRRDISIEKVLELESIEAQEFDKWYYDYKAQAQIKIADDLE